MMITTLNKLLEKSARILIGIFKVCFIVYYNQGVQIMRKQSKICIIFKGDFYCTDFFDYKFLKDVMRDYGISRSSIKDWWKE